MSDLWKGLDLDFGDPGQSKYSPVNFYSFCCTSCAERSPSINPLASVRTRNICAPNPSSQDQHHFQKKWKSFRQWPQFWTSEIFCHGSFSKLFQTWHISLMAYRKYWNGTKTLVLKILRLGDGLFSSVRLWELTFSHICTLENIVFL